MPKIETLHIREDFLEIIIPQYFSYCNSFQAALEHYKLSDAGFEKLPYKLSVGGISVSCVFLCVLLVLPLAIVTQPSTTYEHYSIIKKNLRVIPLAAAGCNLPNVLCRIFMFWFYHFVHCHVLILGL